MKSLNNWLLVLSVLSCFGCSSPVHEDDRGCAFVSDSIQYRVEFMSAGCVRILSFPEGDTLVTRRLVVDSEKPAFKDYKWEDTGQKLLFRTRELSVVFDKADVAFTFQETSTGKLLLKEKGDRKARNFKRSVAGGEQCLEVTQRFVPTEDEAIYGLGQYQNGIMNYRGKSVLLLQANMDIVNPFLISTNGYGVLWDNYSSTKFEDTKEGYSFTSEVGDASDYYFVYGKNMDEVLAGYRELTGDVPMFGKWVYGFWQSKERYKSFDELKAVVKEYRKRGIPLDNIVQDWEYWGDKLSGIIKRQIYQIISEEGLDITPEQWVLLVNLWENDGQTIGDLVTQSQKDFANVTRIVEKLSKNGYIIKRKNHKDGRSVPIN